MAENKGCEMVTIRECVRAASEAGVRLGVSLEPWRSRAIREGVCEAMTRCEDRLELDGRRRDVLRGVRRRLELELWG